jgi:isoleucyl-tRNA synthetase
MKAIASAIQSMDASAIDALERDGKVEVQPADGEGSAWVDVADVEILTEDIPGWLVSSAGGVTVALDITLDDSLKAEGLARELVNRVQNLRKDSGLEVTDRIELIVQAEAEIQRVLKENLDYIAQETLASEVTWSELVEAEKIELSEGISVALAITKMN